MKTKEEILELWGEVTSNFSSQYYIETDQGNFIFEEPNKYPGCGNLWETRVSYHEWVGTAQGLWGRSKGGQYIKDFCDFNLIPEDQK